MKNEEIKRHQIKELVKKLGGVEVVEAILCGDVDYLDHWGLPAGEDRLENGQTYLVEAFNFTSWGYVAQLMKLGNTVSKQYRVTTIQHMVPGTNYKVRVSHDSDSALGVRAHFTAMPK